MKKNWPSFLLIVGMLLQEELSADKHLVPLIRSLQAFNVEENKPLFLKISFHAFILNKGSEGKVKVKNWTNAWNKCSEIKKEMIVSTLNKVITRHFVSMRMP